MVAVALAFAVLDAGGSVSAVGLVLAAATLPLVGTVLIGGVVADRISRRAVMIAADLVRIGSQGAMAVLVITGSAEIWMLAALGGLTGAATGFFNPASSGLMPEVVSVEQLQPANALRATAASGGEIFGPLAAGLLVAAAGPGWAIAVDALTFAISAGCLLALQNRGRKRVESISFIGDLGAGWVSFRSRRWVWSFVAYFALANMFWGAWSALGPVVADRDLGGAAAWGIVLATLGVGALLGSLVATQVNPRKPLVFVALTEALFGLPLAFLASGVPVPVLAFGALLSGAGMMLGMSVWESTLQRHIPADSLSRVSSYDWFGSLAFAPLGLAVWGPVAGIVGVSVALWIAFALFLVAVVALLALPEIRQLPASPSPSPAIRPPAVPTAIRG